MSLYSYLNSLTAFHNKSMSSVGEKRVVDVVHLCFIKAFPVSHNFLIDALTKYRLGKWTMK